MHNYNIDTDSVIVSASICLSLQNAATLEHLHTDFFFIINHFSVTYYNQGIILVFQKFI